ncbi:MAG: class IV adenylate cyclase [Acidobacteriota bacterium]|jgi:adenylate cyclase class 2
MAIEYEVKLRGERDDLLNALERAGARAAGPRMLEDDYVLDTAERRILASGGLLRLRCRDDGFLLTLKGRSDAHGEVKAMSEVETSVSDGMAARRLLEGLGYGVAMRYQKYRTPFECPDCEALAVTLDETPVGCFLEIEGEPTAIHRCAAALGFSRADYETRSYLEIHRAENGAGDMVFDPAADGDAAADTGARPAQ